MTKCADNLPHQIRKQLTLGCSWELRHVKFLPVYAVDQLVFSDALPDDISAQELIQAAKVEYQKYCPYKVSPQFNPFLEKHWLLTLFGHGHTFYYFGLLQSLSAFHELFSKRQYQDVDLMEPSVLQEFRETILGSQPTDLPVQNFSFQNEWKGRLDAAPPKNVPILKKLVQTNGSEIGLLHKLLEMKTAPFT
eukprot:Platyproteum_vivax@DN2221_c0_g1_i2.p1